MNLLISGGAGFIGTNFVYYWLDHHPDDQIFVLDALTYAGNRDNLARADNHPGFTFVHGNILDQPLVENLLVSHDIDTIVHFAAESHVDRSIQGPDAFIETNIVGTHTLLKAARNIWLDKAPRPGHDRRYAIDAAKITTDLGYVPETGFDQGIAKTVVWYLENRKKSCPYLASGV